MINVMFTNRNKIKENSYRKKRFCYDKKQRKDTKKQPGTECIRLLMADRVGFEPTDADASLAFKTSSINHSDTYPRIGEC